jgi:hypothetical protein
VPSTLLLLLALRLLQTKCPCSMQRELQLLLRLVTPTASFETACNAE